MMLRNYFDVIRKKLNISDSLAKEISSILSSTLFDLDEKRVLSRYTIEDTFVLRISVKKSIKSLRKELNLNKTDYDFKKNLIQEAREQKSEIKSELKYIRDTIESINSMEKYALEYRKPNLKETNAKLSYFASKKKQSIEELKYYLSIRDESMKKEVFLSEKLEKLTYFIHSEKIFTKLYESEELEKRKPASGKSLSKKKEAAVTKSHVQLKSVKSTGPEYSKFDPIQVFVNEPDSEYNPRMMEPGNFSSAIEISTSNLLSENEVISNKSNIRFLSPAEKTSEKSFQMNLSRNNIERLGMIEKRTQYSINKESVDQFAESLKKSQLSVLTKSISPKSLAAGRPKISIIAKDLDSQNDIRNKQRSQYLSPTLKISNIRGEGKKKSFTIKSDRSIGIGLNS